MGRGAGWPRRGRRRSWPPLSGGFWRVRLEASDTEGRPPAAPSRRCPRTARRRDSGKGSRSLCLRAPHFPSPPPEGAVAQQKPAVPPPVPARRRGRLGRGSRPGLSLLYSCMGRLYPLHPLHQAGWSARRLGGRASTAGWACGAVSEAPVLGPCPWPWSHPPASRREPASSLSPPLSGWVTACRLGWVRLVGKSKPAEGFQTGCCFRNLLPVRAG